MPMIYIHGVRHRAPDKLEGMKRKLTGLLDGLRKDVPAIPENFAVSVPYWGKFGVQPRIAGLLPIDAPARESAAGRERRQEPEGEASLEVLRDASSDDADAMRALLLQELGQMSLAPGERDAMEALLMSDWQATYLQQHAAGARAAGTGRDGAEGRERLDAAEPARARDLVRERSLAQRLVDLVDRTASKLVFDQEWVRRWTRTIQDSCALFMGDAMAYVIQRESKGAESPILRTVLEALPPPLESSRAPREPLIIMTHSMGAAICYDILTTFRPDLFVDCWVSVGSQVGQFANLGLLAGQPEMRPGERIRGLESRVRCWRNIFDRYDFLNYLTEPAFTHVQDREYANARGPAVSHSWYFKEEPFWDLVRQIIKQAITERGHA